MQLSLDLSGPLDGARLAATVRALLRRHRQPAGVLRARRTAAGAGDPARPGAAVAQEDLSGWTMRRARQRLTADPAEGAVRFDPSSAPLLRFVLVRLDVQRHRLLMTNHHLLLDGWSMPLLLAELLTLYRLGDGGASLRVTAYRDYCAGWRRPGSGAGRVGCPSCGLPARRCWRRPRGGRRRCPSGWCGNWTQR